jgi:hypothetical protein
MPKHTPRGGYSNPEENTIFDLGGEALRLSNPLITNLLAPILVQVVPPEVTPSGCQQALHAVMEASYATSFRSPRTPVTTATSECILPHILPSPVKTKVVSTPSTSGNGPISSSTSTTALFSQSVMGPPFSYGMPDFDSN